MKNLKTHHFIRTCLSVLGTGLIAGIAMQASAQTADYGDVVTARSSRTALWYRTDISTTWTLNTEGYSHNYSEAGLSVDVFPDDINGDGLTDILVGTDTGRIRLFSLDPSAAATVDLKTSYAVNDVEYRGVAIGDIDGDALPDFISTRSFSPSGGSSLVGWYEIDTATFTDPSSYPSTGVISRQAYSSTSTSNEYFDVEFSPFDVGANGKPDVFVTRGGLNPGGGLFGVFEIDPVAKTITRTDYKTIGFDNFIYSIAFAETDFDGDSVQDIVIGRNGYISWYEYTTPGGAGNSFDRLGLINTGVDSFDVVITDVDGDALPDILAAQAGGVVAWYELDDPINNQDGSFDEFHRRGYYQDPSGYDFTSLIADDINQDGVMEVYAGRDNDPNLPDSGGALMILTFDSSNSFTGADAVEDSGDEFTLLVTNPVAQAGYKEIAMIKNAEPRFFMHPLDKTVSLGSDVTLSAVARGPETLTYQWKKDGSPLSNGGNISGADTSTLSITGVSSTDAGNYTVEVDSASYSVIESNAATLSISTGISDWSHMW